MNFGDPYLADCKLILMGEYNAHRAILCGNTWFKLKIQYNCDNVINLEENETLKSDYRYILWCINHIYLLMKSNMDLDIVEHRRFLNENLKSILVYVDYFCIKIKKILKYLSEENLRKISKCDITKELIKRREKTFFDKEICELIDRKILSQYAPFKETGNYIDKLEIGNKSNILLISPFYQLRNNIIHLYERHDINSNLISNLRMYTPDKYDPRLFISFNFRLKKDPPILYTYNDFYKYFLSYLVKILHVPRELIINDLNSMMENDLN